MVDAAADLDAVETLPRPSYDAVRGGPCLEQPTMVGLAHDHRMHGSRERTSSCDPSRRATRVVVDLGAIRHNVRLVRATVGPGVRLTAMVKANAYGHGAVPVARACVEAGATGLAVATVDEGLALRRSGITAPLLVLGASAPEEHAEALRHDLTLAVGSLRMADNVAAAARATGVTARVHVEVDTGMSYNHTFRPTRASVLGLVPLGFADGLPRLLSNRGHMLVRGRRCPIVGRVCMDQTVLDVTDVPGVRVGEPVVVLGCQGGERIGADEIGLHAGTNAYETLCRIGPRVPRDYTDA